MVSELESLGGANSVLTRIRCFAHILNLVVKVRVLQLLLHSSANVSVGYDRTIYYQKKEGRRYR